MDIHCSNLILEVTRRCNMACPHCLRGEAEAMDIGFDTIENALRDITQIEYISFTGGEPTMNIPAMRYSLDCCKKRSIGVSGFYIVTNGKEVSDDFLHLCIDWDTYCKECSGDDEDCVIALSKDIFHQDIQRLNELRLRSLSFFREDHFTSWEDTMLLDLGRARALSGYEKRKPLRYPMEVEINGDMLYVESNLAISTQGDVLPTCDYEFREAKSLSIGNINENPLGTILLGRATKSA